MTLDGTPLSETSPDASIRAGIAFAPADRKRLSGIASWTLAENVTLPRLSSRGPLSWMGVRHERHETTQWLERLNVVPAASDAMFSSLSGGNQQKTVLARWLGCGAGVYLLEEPTAGVDIGAKGAIYQSLAGVAKTGAGVLITSTDVEEVCSICDRVLVMRDGRIAAVLRGEDRTEERVLGQSMRTSPTPPGEGDHVRD